MIRGTVLLLVFLAAANPAAADPAAADADMPASLRQDIGPVAPFTLIDSTGRPFDSASLQGKVWVAHFFFTTCRQCAEYGTTATVDQLRRGLAHLPNVAFVSISVHPESDTPEQLARYARDFQADSRWTFLTGKEAEVHAVVQKSFFQAVARSEKPSPGNEVDHTFRLVLVDGTGTIRGYVDARKAAEVDALRRRILELAGTSVQPVFPAINAGLNTLCALLLIGGWLAIRARKVGLHKACMLSALVVSAVFLANYLYYHLVIQGGQPTRFQGQGILRTVYFAVLLSHTILAVVVTPLALRVAWLGLKDRLAGHVRLARWTLPLWLYVSITGVVVYWMLYRLVPPG